MKTLLAAIFIIFLIGVGAFWAREVFGPQPKPLARPERTITIIEGWNLRDIAAYFEREGVMTRADLYAITGEPARRAPGRWDELVSDKPAKISLEGYLFPDTYRIYTSTTPEAVVQKLLANFDAKARPELQKLPAGRSLHEILTMASIIEAEVPKDPDRRRVSDILWRRLARGWALQVDASVGYVTGHNRERSTAKDLKTDSLWNTYQYPGLPPGPIGNPGLFAIRAALNPDPNPYWYYLTGGDNQVHYARTFEEHIANKKIYLK